MYPLKWEHLFELLWKESFNQYLKTILENKKQASNVRKIYFIDIACIASFPVSLKYKCLLMFEH